MLFRSRPPDLKPHPKINSTVITKVTVTKFVGVIIDDRLNWKPHIQSVNSKLSNLLSAGMSTSYCSLFQPYISYRNGFASDTADWFRSYLLDRQQLVSCHNKLSGKRQLNIGVPQGSVLGTLLFLI